MTDRRGQSTEDAAPDSFAEAAETVRRDPALNSGSGADFSADDAGTDDDARTPDTAHSDDVQKS